MVDEENSTPSPLAGEGWGEGENRIETPLSQEVFPKSGRSTRLVHPFRQLGVIPA